MNESIIYACVDETYTRLVTSERSSSGVSDDTIHKIRDICLDFRSIISQSKFLQTQNNTARTGVIFLTIIVN